MQLLALIPRWLWRLAFLICLISVLVLSLLNDPDPRLSTGWDKGNHVLAFCVLTLLGRWSFPQQALLLAAGLCAYGIAIEILQALSGYRFAEYADLLADALGIALGFGLFASASWAQRRIAA